MGLLKPLVWIRLTIVLGVLFVKSGNAYGQKPIIESLSPDNGLHGEKIRIFGSNFQQILGITFNGTLAPVFAVTAQNQLEVTVPAGATSGPISIQNASGIGISSEDFTIYNPGPRPMGFDPPSGVIGDIITVEGSLFSPQTQVIFANNVIATQVLVRTEGELDVVIPPGAVSGPVTLRDARGSNTSIANFSVVTINDISFSFVTPARSILRVGEENPVSWAVSSGSSAGASQVELTFLLPESGAILAGVETSQGQWNQVGRFVQISGGAITSDGQWTGSLIILPTVESSALNIEGSVSASERDPDISNNSIVHSYQSVIGAGKISFKKNLDNSLTLSWPAYPDTWKLFSTTNIRRTGISWSEVTITPIIENHRKSLTIQLSPQATPPILYYRIRR